MMADSKKLLFCSILTEILIKIYQILLVADAAA